MHLVVFLEAKVLSMTLEALLKQVHPEILNVSMRDLRSLFILAIIENLTETLGNFSDFFCEFVFFESSPFCFFNGISLLDSLILFVFFGMLFCLLKFYLNGMRGHIGN